MTLWDELWEHYVNMTPQAKQIHKLLKEKNEEIVNDHIALRTFDHEKIGIQQLAQYFYEQEYYPGGVYSFPEKHLTAIHLEHDDKTRPKVFISHLHIDKLSKENQELLEMVLSHVQETPQLLDRPWPAVTTEMYKKLEEESPYAAWVVAHGFIPNHFTISVNHLSSFNNIRELNNFIKEQDIKLNLVGGEVKGSKGVYLEQSATVADEIYVKFMDDTIAVPGCFYEFAQRFEQEDGTMYQGFIMENADKIFHSTDAK